MYMNKFIILLKKLNYKNFKKVIRHIKINGFHGLRSVIYEHLKDPLHYNEWFGRHRIKEEELETQRKHKFDFEPKISILVPTYNTDLNMLHEMIDSLISQSYSNWELCIADGSQGNDALEKELLEYSNKD